MPALTYNLHMHSCLSPCGADDMTPYNAVNMCALCGYDIVALTDHNSAANCRAAAIAAKVAGVIFVPGLELTTEEEVHVLCLFATLEDAEAFSDYVYSRLPNIDNQPDIFGHQLLMDDADAVRGELSRMLSNATAINCYEVAALAAHYNGIAIPAHIDRASFSLLANLGFIDEEMGFSVVEVSRYAPEDFVAPLPFISSSDAHDLSAIPDAENRLVIAEKTPKAVIDALRAL